MSYSATIMNSNTSNVSSTNINPAELPKLEGYLHKKKSGVFGGWNQRWFKIEEINNTSTYNSSSVEYQYVLSYYENDKHTKPSKMIDFKTIASVMRVSNTTDTFILKAGRDQPYTLKANTSLECDTWYNGINQYIRFRIEQAKQRQADILSIASGVAPGAMAGAVSPSSFHSSLPSPNTTTAPVTSPIHPTPNGYNYNGSPAQISMASQSDQPSVTGTSSNGMVGIRPHPTPVRPSSSGSISRDISDIDDINDGETPRIKTTTKHITRTSGSSIHHTITPLKQHRSESPIHSDDEDDKHTQILSNKSKLHQLTDDPDMELQLSDEEPEDDDEPVRPVAVAVAVPTKPKVQSKSVMGVGKAHPPKATNIVATAPIKKTTTEIDLDDDWDAPVPAATPAPVMKSTPTPAPIAAPKRSTVINTVTSTTAASGTEIDMSSWDSDDENENVSVPTTTTRRAPPTSIPAPFISKSTNDQNKRKVSVTATFPDAQKLKPNVSSPPLNGVQPIAVTADQGWLEEDFDA